MAPVVMRLEEGFSRWSQRTAQDVTAIINEIIELADCDCLDVGSSRRLQQEVLDSVDNEPHLVGNN